MTPEERAVSAVEFQCVMYADQKDLEKRVAAAIRKAVAEEREACAKIVDEWNERDLGFVDSSVTGKAELFPDPEMIAAAIRKRGHA